MMLVNFLCRDNFGVLACVRRGCKFDYFQRITVLFHFLLCLIFRVTAKHNISTTACHIGCNRHGIEFARLRDDFGLLLVILCVEDVVRDAFSLQNTAQFLTLFNAYRAHEQRLSRCMMVYDVLHDCGEFSACFGVNLIVFVNTSRRLVRGNRDDVEVVYSLKFRFFRLCSTRHTREFLVHTEEVLESDGRKRLVFASYSDVFFCLDCLVQALVVTSAYHNTARELVDDKHFTVADDVVFVLFHHKVRFECGLNMVI